MLTYYYNVLILLEVVASEVYTWTTESAEMIWVAAHCSWGIIIILAAILKSFEFGSMPKVWPAIKLTTQYMGQNGPAPSQSNFAFGKEHTISLSAPLALYRLQQEFELLVLELFEKAMCGWFEVLIGLKCFPWFDGGPRVIWAVFTAEHTAPP